MNTSKFIFWLIIFSIINGALALAYYIIKFFFEEQDEPEIEPEVEDIETEEVEEDPEMKVHIDPDGDHGEDTYDSDQEQKVQ